VYAVGEAADVVDKYVHQASRAVAKAHVQGGVFDEAFQQ
jgi:hypothetical protein